MVEQEFFAARRVHLQKLTTYTLVEKSMSLWSGTHGEEEELGEGESGGGDIKDF